NGTVRENGTFAYPDDNMTRAQFAVMMANYMQLDTDEYASVRLPYQDTDTLPSWARNAIAAMYAHNIMGGKLIQGTLYYDPDAPITRAEISTVLGRSLGKGYTQAELNFTDVADIPSYAKEHIAVFVNLNIISGYSDGSVKPNRAVTRGEAFKLLMKMY
ncbi:MAG: S-layer homology domain-containing protein, partial [Oscillospiraceae bacterium]|nr:S-layer homology domain-containing protein [Oscillospiraceae bacterium]